MWGAGEGGGLTAVFNLFKVLLVILKWTNVGLAVLLKVINAIDLVIVSV